jgi:hypothetical protein
MQVLGSHNSYHVHSPPALFQAVADFSQPIADTLDYGHPPLAEQFSERGIRQIELDVFADPQGGLFAHPLGLAIVTGDPDLRIPELEAPGLKVLHVQDIDYYTNCQTFVECLSQVRAWSEAHPLHAPLMIQVEAKDDVLPAGLGFDFVVPVPIGPAEMDAIDYEIRSVFPRRPSSPPTTCAAAMRRCARRSSRTAGRRSPSRAARCSSASTTRTPPRRST